MAWGFAAVTKLKILNCRNDPELSQDTQCKHKGRENRTVRGAGFEVGGRGHEARRQAASRRWKRQWAQTAAFGREGARPTP